MFSRFARFATLSCCTLLMNAQVKIDKVPYGGWPNCYRISNGEVELIVTSDVGPRIIRYGFVGGQNLFKEYPETLGKSGEATWQLRGGHRIWVAPEDAVRTYAPDNGPVQIKIDGQVLTATQPAEPLTGFEKQLQITLAPHGSEVTVRHQIRNTSPKPQEAAAWALSIMAQNGIGITGFPPRGKHPDVLPPTNPLIMWAFTDLTDPRLVFTKKYLTLRQDPANTNPQKLGHFNKDTWAAYLLGTDLFLKRSAAEPGRTYPDMGSSFEIFTRNDMLEMETLGPIERLAQGQSLMHVEHWTLTKNVKMNAVSDAELDRILLPLLGGDKR